MKLNVNGKRKRERERLYIITSGNERRKNLLILHLKFIHNYDSNIYTKHEVIHIRMKCKERANENEKGKFFVHTVCALREIFPRFFVDDDDADDKRKFKFIFFSSIEFDFFVCIMRQILE